MSGIEIINQRVREESIFIDSIKQEVGKVIVGQSELIDRLIIGLLTNGHILLEGVPGLAKSCNITGIRWYDWLYKNNSKRG